VIFINSFISFPNLNLEFEIGRTAFTFFGLDIYWYGVVVSTAIVLSFMYALVRSEQFGMISDKVFDVAAAGLIGGFIGARLYYVIFHNLNPENQVKYSFSDIIMGIRDGGLAIYGGIIGAVVFSLVYMKLKKVKMLPILDMAGISFLLGIGIGRWGNFFNQEAYGAATAGDLPWGMTGSRIAYEVGDGLVHPCFLYESLWCLLGFTLLHFYSKKFRTYDGELFLLFAAWYGTGRLFNEQLRTDSLMLGDLKISQVLAAVSAGIALIIFICLKIRTGKEQKLFKNTEESIWAVSSYEENMRIQKEKKAAKKALKKEETAPSILGEDEHLTNGDL